MTLRLFLWLALMVPAWALIGYGVGGASPWLGVLAGAAVGVFFGLVFGRVRGRWLDWFYPRERWDGAQTKCSVAFTSAMQ